VAERDEQPGDTNDAAPNTDNAWDRSQRQETPFRRHARRVTVDVAHRLAQIGLAVAVAVAVAVVVAVVGMVLLIFDVVSGLTAGVVAATAAAALLGGLWVALPLAIRESRG
jgi:hypothetical protein